MTATTVLMTADEIDRALARMAHQVLEVSGEGADVALVGIHTRGAPLARRIAEKIASTGAEAPPVGALDINLYRDDFSTAADHPIVRRTEIPFDIVDRRIVLVDDVLFTGRTIRAALDALFDLGRPRAIRLAVLVDRGGKELPIHADFVGRSFTVQPHQLVDVLLEETDEAADQVLLRPRGAPADDHEPDVAPAEGRSAKRASKPRAGLGKKTKKTRKKAATRKATRKKASEGSGDARKKSSKKKGGKKGSGKTGAGTRSKKKGRR